VCGICGVIQIGGTPRPVVAPEVLDRMTDAMTHRGPNDRGTHAADGVALGARRLSIVDVEGGHQPFANENGRIWAVQNGELYNHDALRALLTDEGHVFRTRCDTEVIPHLYERHGLSFQEKLRGKFGLAVWDEERRRAVLARDRLGIKPLYWSRSRDLVVFASELKSLLASGLVQPELDFEAIDAYLVLGFVPGPRTPLRGVRKLLPGHRLVVEPESVREERYWAFPLPSEGPGPGSFDDCAEGLLTVLEDSVRLRLMSDVPLGAMLSGGLDSSLIVALMARHSIEPVKTFSVGFAEAGESNELAQARLVAGALGTEHHELELSLADGSVGLEELVWYLDEPLADLSALGFLALSELAARSVTVALSGQGADELLGGYTRHRNAALVGSLERLPGPVRRLAGTVAARGPARSRRAAIAFGAPDSARRLVTTKANVSDALRAELARGPLLDLSGDTAYRIARGHLDRVRDDPLAATLYLDAQLGLVDDMLHYFDRASMAHSLEVRVPFLDHEVVEYCARIPARFKVRRLTTKAVLKRAARGLVPNTIIDRPKVGFFNAAVAAWFRAQADGAVSDYLLDSSPRYGAFLDPDVVKSLVRSHAAGGADGSGDALLTILMLEIWLSSYLPRAVRAAAPPRERIELVG
jgi:asparagine synthase (glutamine-hydrolysing)